MHVINLIPQHHIEARGRRSRLRTWTTLCIVWAALLAGTCGALHVSWGSTTRAVADELARVTRELEQTNKSVAEIQPDLAEAQLQLEASRAVAVQPDWSVLLALLGKTRGTHIVLSRAVLTPTAPPIEAKPKPAAGGGKAPAVNTALRPPGKKPADASARKRMNFKVEIAGLGKSQSDVSQFVLRLEQTDLFQRVKLVETTLHAFNNEAIVAFRVECLMTEEAQVRK